MYIGYLPRTTEEKQAGFEAPPLNPRNSNAQGNVDDETRSQLSSEVLDRKDGILVSSSTPEPPVDSDSEESHNDTTPTQHLLQDLQKNLEGIRVNVIELTQSLLRRRASL